MKAAFTIATANYLSQAKTLADSFLTHNPDYKFVICLLDKIAGRFDTSYFLPAEIVEVESMCIDGFDEMLNIYSLFELSNALKPFAADFLLKRNDLTQYIIYFDSDIFIYNRLTEAEVLLSNHNIVLTSHFSTPLPLDGFMPNENVFLNSGVFNGGFFALKKNDETDAFLDWWKQRLRTECKIDFCKGLFVDQLWLNFVPILFDKVCIFNSKGYNVAYWNLHERRIIYDSGLCFVNNTSTPLVFFHFSGFDFNKPTIISKHQNRYYFENKNDVKILFEDYLKIAKANQYDLFDNMKCYYISTSSDEVIAEKVNAAPVTNKSYKTASVFMSKLKNIIKTISTKVWFR